MAVDKPGGGGGASSSSSSPASTTDRFLKIVLSWDYLRIVADSKVHSNPSAPTNGTAITPDGIPEPSPSPGWGGQGANQAKGLQHVKNSYASVDEYLGVFEPLLFEEVKAQILQGRRNEEEEEDGGLCSTCRLCEFLDFCLLVY